MSPPRTYQQPQWRPEAHITPQQFINNHQHHYPYPSFVTPFTIHNHSYPYYHQGNSGSPCNISLHYNRFNMPDQRDAVEATGRPAKRSKVAAEKKQQAKPSPPGKGLRHFSMKICERVKGMGTTSYNEVADELIKELREDEAKALQASSESSATSTSKKDPTSKKKKTKPHQSKYDEKNIRRRVYDALNVLMAMEIIVKDKKQIVWNGFPGQRTIKTANSAAYTSNKMAHNEAKEPSKELLKLREERDRRRAELERKREILQELLTQNVCFNNLYQRNHGREVALMTTQQNQVAHAENDTEKIPLPFIVVNTNHQAVIQCEMCPQKTNVSFDFTMPFEINDDNEILKKIGMDRTTLEEFQRMVPPDLYHYCYSKGMLENIVHPRIYGYAR